MTACSARVSLAGIAAFFRRVQVATVLVGVGWLVWRLSPVLVPFAVALLLGWAGDPVVDRLQARGWSRSGAVAAVFVVMIVLALAALLVLVPIIERQVVTLGAALPRYRDWLLGVAAPWLSQRTGVDLARWFSSDVLVDVLRQHWRQAGGFAAGALALISKSSFALMALTANLVLIPILTFFFLRDWDTLVERIGGLVPRDYAPTVARLASESSAMLRAFLRGQLLVMAILAGMYAVGLRLVGLELGVLIGLLAGLLSFVPYLGPATLLVLGSAAALAQFGDWHHLLGVGAVFAVGQLIESYWLTPKLVGDRIGLSEVTVIFAVMAGGTLFGFLGMLLALPVAAVANVLLCHAQERYRASELYRGAASAAPVLVTPDGALAQAQPSTPPHGEA